MKVLDRKVDYQELESLKQDINQKTHKHDFEMLQVQFNNHRLESEAKLKNNDKDIDEFIETIQNELAALKNNMVASLNKKADFNMMDRLNEQMAKKVDNEHLRQGLT